MTIDPHITVEIECASPFLTFTAYYRGTRAGIAKFTIEKEDQAELGDVEVYERGPHWWWPARTVGLKLDYRRRGIGSEMMRKALAYLRSIGTREVRGTLGGGDPDIQRAWYLHLGFEIAGDRVSMRL